MIYKGDYVELKEKLKKIIDTADDKAVTLIYIYVKHLLSLF